MKPLTPDQKERINLVLFEIFNRPELLAYMRNQLTENFWKLIEEVEDVPFNNQNSLPDIHGRQ